MDSFRFKEIREALNLSHNELCAVVGLDRNVGFQTILDIEEGRMPVPGTLATLMELIGSSVAPNDRCIPEYLLCSDLSGDASNSDQNRFILRTSYPRCYVGLSKAAVGSQWSVEIHHWIDPFVTNQQEMVALVTESVMTWLYRASASLANNTSTDSLGNEFSAHAQYSIH